MERRNPDIEKIFKAAAEAYEKTEIPSSVKERIHKKVFRKEKIAPSLWGRALIPVASGAIALVLISLFYLISASEGESESLSYAAYVAGFSGSVTLFESGVEKSLTERAIKEGAEVRTGRDGELSLNIGPNRVACGGETSLSFKSLDKKRLLLSLASGAIALDIPPLPPGASIAILSGDSLVEVVGTVFTVERTGGCTAVAVTEGTVKVAFNTLLFYVIGGEKKSFCESELIELSAPDRLSAEISLERPKIPEKPVQAKKEKSRQPKAETRERELGFSLRSLTDEEKLFRAAQNFIIEKDDSLACETLKRYIEEYPNGAFIEDAIFYIIRASYTLNRKREVLSYSETFLARFTEENYRKNEVRVLYAQSLLELDKSPDKALSALQPVVENIDLLKRQYQERAIYLYALAASRVGKRKLSEEWLKYYIERFPNGEYAEEARKYLKSGHR